MGQLTLHINDIDLKRFMDDVIYRNQVLTKSIEDLNNGLSGHPVNHDMIKDCGTPWAIPVFRKTKEE